MSIERLDGPRTHARGTKREIVSLVREEDLLRLENELQSYREASKRITDAWESGDLAAAVNELP